MEKNKVGYAIDGLRKKIEKLEQQIEKMKNCYNCGNNGLCHEVECDNFYMNEWVLKDG